MKKRKWIAFCLIAIGILAIACAGVLLYHFMPTNERMSLTEYFGLENEESYGLVANSEVTPVSPVYKDGRWYLDYEYVKTYVNEYYYYDGIRLYYTNPTETFTATPGSSRYSDGSGTYNLDYLPCYYEGERMMVALEFMKIADQTYYRVDQARQYIWMWNHWDGMGYNTAVDTIERAVYLRKDPDVKSPIVAQADAGEAVIILEDSGEWKKIQNQDGLIGYIRIADAGTLESFAAVLLPPDGSRVPEYTSLTSETAVNLIWQQVFEESGIDKLSQIIKRASGSGVNVLCPTWFTLSDNEGGVKSCADKKYVTRAHKAGFQVWGMVENINIDVDEYTILHSTEARSKIIGQLIRYALKLDLDGINVDFEMIGKQCATDFIQFLRELSAACRNNGLVLSTDNSVPSIYTEYYNRSAQAKVVDYIVVMGYDEHYAGGEVAGSTASISFVEAGVADTIKEVPSQKVIMALPLYTRLWCTASDGTLTSKAYGMEQTESLIQEKKLTETWLEAEQQNYVEYEEDGNRYQLWVEDAKSLGIKLDTVLSYPIGGVAIWQAGRDTAEIWNVITEKLNK